MSELARLQQAISETRAKRGFVTDPLKIHIMLTEEIGEISAELKPLWSEHTDVYDDFDPLSLPPSSSPLRKQGPTAGRGWAVFLLSALATHFNIDLETAVTQKFFQKDSHRPWKSAAK